MRVIRSISRHLPPLILGASLLSIYLYTLAPGLTWANDGSDGGDLITAAYTGGIAHPTGYPLYLILARLFQFIPIGSLAYRTNLMSTFYAVLSALLLYRVVTRTLEDMGIEHIWIAGLTAGFALGLAPLFWSQAVITEVHTLQTFLVVLILYLYFFPFWGLEHKHLERLRGLVLGLAMGNHVTTVFLVPLVFFSGTTRQQGERVLDKPMLFAPSLTRQLVWLAIGLSIYLTLPLRALTNPPINWGYPITLKRFWWLVSGELYQSYYLQFEFVEIWSRLQVWASLLVRQFGWPGLVLAIFGLILLFKPSRLYLTTIWIGMVYSAFALVYLSDDSYLYLIPVLISFAIWMGLTVGHVCGVLTLNAVRWGMCVLILGYFTFHAFGHVGRVDASSDLQAELFGRQVMSEVPTDALVFLKGDQAVFTIWYFHFTLGQRPDVIVIAEELLHFDWYQENLRDAYPLLDIPGPFPWVHNVVDANPARTTCFVQYTTMAEVNCPGFTVHP